ncbi:hypothetical protein JMM81_14690 [Bacillus sp. V3B]|uniref:hypothetical protein n=1 Tax=Bacillus sp. V3B TaxID=2804915 RepID=UPI00210987D7|nr:hypothetical protein [Bacillus sp. V3B]MCQ6276173.1 hypothetical protein [Bacillus sp. V3B]
MPSKQLVDLVNRLKKSGIQISFTEPRSKISIYLQEKPDLQLENEDNSFQQNSKRKRNRTMLKFI